MTDSMLQNALRLRREGRFQEAALVYAQLLAADPNHYGALHAFGTLRYQTGQLEEAERLISAAIAVNPRAADALFNRGCLLSRLNRLEEAVSAFTAAIVLKPAYVEALINRGTTFLRMGRQERALADFETVTRLQPKITHGWHNRGGTLMELERFEDARASFDKAISVDPKYTQAWIGRAAVSLKLGDFRQALTDIDHALTINPDSPQAWEARGNALSEVRRFEDAVSAYCKSLSLLPKNPEALYNRGLAAFYLRRYPDAMRDFESVLALEPEREAVRGDLLFSRLSCCDWRDIDSLKEDIATRLDSSQRAASPFAALLVDDPERPDPIAQRASLQASLLATAFRFPPRPALSVRGRRSDRDKIRVAYVSADFGEHAVARLLTGVLESHDRVRFEMMGISLGAGGGSPMRARLQNAFAHFIDGQSFSDIEVARRIHEWEADIAVDLTGYTLGNRTGIFAFRPAPVQVNWLGFPGTMGAAYIDYLIADAVVIPEEACPYFDEKIIHLPHAYLPHDRSRAIGNPPSRADVGLPRTGFVFAAFNNPYKFTPQMFAIWMRLLHALDGSVLWLSQASEPAKENLRREAAARNIAPERLIFAPHIASDAEHLARMSLADVFLDTLPYNGHATALDALWAGVPVVTVRGAGFPGRVAASLVQAAGCPELATASLSEYESMALKIAQDGALLRVLRAKLAAARSTAPLFDTARFTRHLESAYRTMWERNARGDAPDNFAVRSVPRS